MSTTPESQETEFSLEKLNETKRKIEEYINAEYEKVVASHSELKHILANPAKKIKNQVQGGRRIQFNVGGKRFSTSFANVMREPSILKKVCELDPDQPIFIDRDPECFGLILEYFRNKNVSLVNLRQKSILLEEAKFYEIDGLIELLNTTKSTQSRQTTLQNDSKTTKQKETKQIAEKNTMSTGSKLIELFESEIETSSATLAKLFSLASTQTQEQTEKIKRFFGWEPVKVDVGGTIFEVPLETLKKIPNFSTLFVQEDDGSYFIDRSPDTFQFILRNLREQTVYFHGLKSLSDKYTSDLDFFGIKQTIPLQRDIQMSALYNIKNTNGVLIAQKGVQAFDKNAKSEPIVSRGVTRMTFKLVTSNTRNVMVGFAGELNISSYNLYTSPGAFYYTANNSIYCSNFGTKKAATSNWATSFAVGDTVTVELDVEGSTVKIWQNHDVSTEVLVCDNIPLLPAYHFYVFAYDPSDSFTVTHEI